MVIKIKRSGALGDVILTTPIVRELRERNPDATIVVATDCPQVYTGNPDVNLIVAANSSQVADDFIDLDLAYEMRPKMHIIEAYSTKAFGHCDIFKKTYMYHTDGNMNKVRAKLAADNIGSFVVVHMTVSWANRTMSKDRWKVIVDRIVESGKNVVIVGSGNDYTYHRTGVYDYKNTLSVNEIHALMSMADAFIGMDSGLLHVAGTTDVKLIGVFTCAEAQYRMPFRKGCVAVNAAIDCYGCLHKKKAPVTFAGCDRGDNECVNRIDIDRIIMEAQA